MKETYKIKMTGLYGSGEDGYTAYFRKSGLYGFDFVTNKELATELTKAEVDKIIGGTEYYLKQYNACKLEAFGLVWLGDALTTVSIRKEVA